MKKCFIELSSLTRAYRAREALAKNSLPSSVVKKTGKDGCVHGIELDCELVEIAKRIIEML